MKRTVEEEYEIISEKNESLKCTMIKFTKLSKEQKDTDQNNSEYGHFLRSVRVLEKKSKSSTYDIPNFKQVKKQVWRNCTPNADLNS